MTAISHLGRHLRKPDRRALTLLLVTALLLGSVGLVAAAPDPPDAPEVPESGHAFYGQVWTATGKPAPPGTIVVARTASGAWTGSVSAPTNGSGHYGSAPTLIVPADDPDTPSVKEGAAPGDPVEFYIRGLKVKMWNPATSQWISHFPFAIGGLTRLDLTDRKSVV